MLKHPSTFFWHELITTDPAAATKFYASVVGWRPEAFPGSDNSYTVMHAGDRGVVGIMEIPAEAKERTLRHRGAATSMSKTSMPPPGPSLRPAARFTSRRPTSPASAASPSSPTRRARISSS